MSSRILRRPKPLDDGRVDCSEIRCMDSGDHAGPQYRTLSFLCCAYRPLEFDEAMTAIRARHGLVEPPREIAYKNMGGGVERADGLVVGAGALTLAVGVVKAHFEPETSRHAAAEVFRATETQARAVVAGVGQGQTIGHIALTPGEVRVKLAVSGVNRAA